MKQLLLLTLGLMPYLGVCQSSFAIETTIPADSITGNWLRIRDSDTTLIADPMATSRKRKTFGDTTTIYNPETGDSERLIYIEQMPQPGYNLEAYLANRTNCPISQFNSANKKRINVQFIVKADGSITDVKVVTHLHPNLDSIAKQAISNMPKWKPGKQNGKVADVYFTQPVYFDSTR